MRAELTRWCKIAQAAEAPNLSGRTVVPSLVTLVDADGVSVPRKQRRWSEPFGLVGPEGTSRAAAQYLPLTPEVIAKHLEGQTHIGLYPLLDDGTCWWVAADFDKEAAMLDALAFMKAAREHGIPAALEVSQSGRGAHVWIFFAQPIVAAIARRIATSLLGEAFRLRGSMHLRSYDRLFPS